MLSAGLNRWMADALIELYQDYRRSGTDGYAAQVSDTVRARRIRLLGSAGPGTSAPLRIGT